MADATVLWPGLSDIFQRSQRTIASHSLLVSQLKNGFHDRALAQGAGDLFTRTFVQLLCHVLPVAKSEPVGDRVVSFVSAYMAYLVSSAEHDRDPDTSYDHQTELYYEFIEHILHSILPGIVSKDKVVRYRTCQIVLSILQQAGELSDEECQSIRDQALLRTYDKDHSVRTQAALIIAMLIDPDDRSPTSQDSVLRGRLEELVQHDPSAEVRRAALFNLTKERDNYPIFVAAARDVNSVNRRMVYSRIIPSLGDFRQLKIDDREKLLNWGLQDRDNLVSESAKKMLVGNWLRTVDNDLIALLERIDVLNSKVAERALEAFFNMRRDVVDAKMVFEEAFWQNLSQEGAFLVRCFNDYCLKYNLENLIDERLPVLTRVAYAISSYWNECSEMEPESQEYTELEFIVEQLLMLARSYDLGDEAGRRALVAALQKILTTPTAPSETVVRQVMRIYRKMAVSESDFLLTALELIEDVRDALTPEEDADTTSSQNSRTDLEFMLVCLSIAEEALRLIEHPIDDKPRLRTLYDGYIQPALQSSEPSIGDRGTRCLGLLCLINREIADFGVPMLVDGYNTIQEDPNDVQLEERRIIVQSLCDNVLVHGSVFEGTVGIFLQMLVADDDPQVCAIAGESLAKLLLCDLISDPSILKQLLVTYFSSAGAENLQLKQSLAFFFPVYCLTSATHQQAVAGVAVKAIQTVLELSEGTRESSEKLTASQMVNQIIDWTDPTRLRNGVTSNSHIILCLDMVTSLADFPGRGLERALSSALGKLHLKPDAPGDTLHSIQARVSTLQAQPGFDGIVNANLKRFNEKLQLLHIGTQPGNTNPDCASPDLEDDISP